MSKEPRNATFRQIMQVGLLLEANLSRIGETDKWEYLNGYNDEKVASEVGCSKNTVINFRQKEYGPVKRQYYNGKSGPKYKQRLDELEARLARLEQALGVEA